VLLKLETYLGLCSWEARSRSSEASSAHDRVLASVIRKVVAATSSVLQDSCHSFLFLRTLHIVSLRIRD
jgi:hypothetical protein